jgi:hypothetical protein
MSSKINVNITLLILDRFGTVRIRQHIWIEIILTISIITSHYDTLFQTYHKVI